MKKLKKFKLFVLNNKKLVFKVSGFVFLGIVLLVFIVYLIFNYQSILLSNDLKKLGKNYYEDYYYDQLEGSEKEVQTFLNSFSDKGLTISLKTLSSYNGTSSMEKTEKFFNKSCDSKNTYVIIYPKDPYDNKSYTVKTVLDCK